MTEMGRPPSDGLSRSQRQLSRIGVSQAQPEHGAGDFGKVPTGGINAALCRNLGAPASKFSVAAPCYMRT